MVKGYPLVQCFKADKLSPMVIIPCVPLLTSCSITPPRSNPSPLPGHLYGCSILKVLVVCWFGCDWFTAPRLGDKNVRDTCKSVHPT